MKTETTTIHTCDFCKKRYVRIKAAIRHEERYRKNPKNEIPCHSCRNFDMKNVAVRKVNYQDVEYTNIYKMGYCNAKKYYVYPYDCNNPVLSEDVGDGDVENEPMPKMGECSEFVSY